MPVIQRDEYGLWIDLEYGAIRPPGRSNFKEGEEIDSHHFGGSTLHGVGKVAGARGCYREAWLSAPEASHLHDARQLVKSGRSQLDISFSESFDSFVEDAGALIRGNPSFCMQEPLQNIVKLKNGRERFLASIGYGFGKKLIKTELLLNGQALIGYSRESARELSVLNSATQQPAEPELASSLPKRAPRI